MKIFEIFSKQKFLAIFLALCVFFLAFYFVVNGIFVLSLLEFNQTAEPLRVALTVLISLLSALAFTVWLYRQEQPLVCAPTAAGFGGSVLALFATACPICFPALLSLVGIGGATALAVSANAIPIQIASIALLVASIWLTTKK